MNSTQNFGRYLDQEEEDMLIAMQLNCIRIVSYAIKTVIELDLLEIVGRKYIKDEEGFSMAPTVVFSNLKIEDDSCSHVTASILVGGLKPYETAKGTSLFEHFEKNESSLSYFNEMMINQTSLIMKKLLKIYNGFESLGNGVLVDIGGNLGANPVQIISKCPHLKDVNFDLPHVVAESPNIPEHVGGDMFDAIPQDQAIFLKWILHDWNDEQCVVILKNCKKVLPKDGKVVIVESIVPREISETDLATKVVLHMDMTMMCKTIGGNGKTKEEFDFLATEDGFKLPQITYGVYANWIL